MSGKNLFWPKLGGRLSVLTMAPLLGIPPPSAGKVSGKRPHTYIYIYIFVLMQNGQKWLHAVYPVGTWRNRQGPSRGHPKVYPENHFLSAKKGWVHAPQI